MTKFSKIIFYLSLLFLIIVSLYPGSLFGYLFFGDFGRQPNLISNPFGTTINHFISYVVISSAGFFIYYNSNHFNKLVYLMFFLSFILEISQFLIPYRSFQIGDLVGNILGVIFGYFVVKIYLFLKKL
tara:strand:- start:72 stop:455 length:384 start_codon:yes stop_codon:yes gene_type:complete